MNYGNIIQNLLTEKIVIVQYFILIIVKQKFLLSYFND